MHFLSLLRLEGYHCGQKTALISGGVTRFMQQIKNIIILASGYARFHPGADGNNRTAVIILNSELIKHHFYPSILENPNRLEGFPQEKLLQEV